MARTKPPKAQKTSYTERVLGAMTQIQKEHRKHSIHMATLRAQIRKNADAKRDKLGPNWSSWVTKAVQKLAEDGVLEHPSAQEVTFTQTGKQIITTAKKATPDEDHIWRHVSTSISLGRKRRRSSTGFSQDAGSSVSTKRPRKSVNGIVGSIHMTPTRSPRKSLGKQSPRTPAQVTFRDMSPLTDVSEDNGDRDRENASLKAQLRGKEKELEELRNRLRSLEGTTSVNLTGPSSHHGAPVHLSMDASQPTTPLRTPARPGTVSTTTRLQVPKGITRTQSGTYIPNISKHPTPAPSDSGDEHEPGSMVGMDALTPPEAATWLTPSRSTSRNPLDRGRFPLNDLVSHASRHEDTDVEDDDPVVNVDDDLTSMPRSDVGRAVLVGRVEELERLLGEKEVTISDLQIVKDGLEAQKSSFQEEITVLQNCLREETVNQEQARSESDSRANEITALKQALGAVETDRDGVHARLVSAQEIRLDLEAKFNEAERLLGAGRAELATAMDKIDEMTTQIVEKDATIVKLEASLATGREEVVLCHDRIRQLEISVKDLQIDNEAEKNVYKDLHLQLDERTKQVEGLELELLNEKGIRESLEKSLSSTTNQLASVEGRLLEVQRSADEKGAAFEQVKEELSGVEVSKAELQINSDNLEKELGFIQQQWSDSQDLVERLNRELAASQAMVQDLSAKLADAARDAAAAEESGLASEKRAEATQQELNRKISALEEKTAVDRDLIDALHSKLGDLEMQLDQERAALVGIRADGLRTTVELEAEKTRSAVLEEEKIHTEQRVRSLEEEVAVLRTGSIRNAANFEELKTFVEGFRQNQITSIDSLVQKVSTLDTGIHLLDSVGSTAAGRVLTTERQRVQL